MINLRYSTTSMQLLYSMRHAHGDPDLLGLYIFAKKWRQIIDITVFSNIYNGLSDTCRNHVIYMGMQQKVNDRSYHLLNASSGYNWVQLLDYQFGGLKF